ncbi:DUF2303 family protein [Thauera sp.]|uniref:DUF2303 family protein n=1 Tax=Thauera sp. TaxID=1905334 RepID=UPI0039E4B2B7
MNDTNVIELDSMSNIAETLAREMKQPIQIDSPVADISRVALPPGWTLKETDDEKHAHTPRRKSAKVSLHDAPSFIDYVRRHGSLAYSTVWCVADYAAGNVNFTAILNDHGEPAEEPQWRDHRASYMPTFSQEWENWVGKNKKSFSQAEFAQFIEDNLKDVAGAEGLPTGAQMLEMALYFEANQDMRFKSAIRLQNGGVQMSFVQDDDSQTLTRMQLFERFAIGIPVFWGGDAYRIDARLRYRVRDGKLTFWFELIRQDKTLESATSTLIEQIRTGTGNPFFFGNPFSN